MSLTLDVRCEPHPVCALPDCGNTLPRKAGRRARFCSQRCRDASYSIRRAEGSDVLPTPAQWATWLEQHRAALLPFRLEWKVMVSGTVVGEGASPAAAVKAAMRPGAA